MLREENCALISVVLTTYNGEEYVEKQLESIFNQTYQNLEIIIVDDCSQDDTVIILKRIASKHPNMKVFVNDSNIGYVKNFEKGCLLSSGEYIALCDQDDYWNKDKLSLLAEAIGTYPMIYSDSYVCNENLENTGQRISDKLKLNAISNCLQQAVFCGIYGHTTLFTRSLFEKAYPFLEVIPHDWWLAYVASIDGGIEYLNIPLTYYRQHKSNLVGAVGGKSKKDGVYKNSKFLKMEKIRKRITAFSNLCPPHLEREKRVLTSLARSYKSFSIYNNFWRVFIFLKNFEVLLAVKKRSKFRKYLFCFKMFATIK